jgi:Predicted permeases
VTYVVAALLGGLAGVLAGMFGVGGGILFVPVLVGLGLGQHDATGTSLLAILPTVVVGTWRQARYGNVRWEPALVLGVASVGAAQGGAFLAEALPAHVLRKLFAVLLVLVAGQIAWRAFRPGRADAEL